MASSVLIVLHQERSSPGRIGHHLVRRGFHLDIRRPCLGDPLPASLRDHAGAIIFGGPQSANDDHDYVRAEIDWIGVPLAEGKPYLGICLGAQMLARHLGARVERHPEGLVEIGYYPLWPTDAGARLFGAGGGPEELWPDHVYHWHKEGFELPSGADLLAEGEAFPNQAFSFGGRAFGIQFHPEVTHHMMCRWTVRGAERFALPGARPGQDHFHDRLRHDPKVRRWLDVFIDHWLAPAAPPVLA
ncbi:glutamine amidotransferase [Ancylobacter terrae]|uniref:glutamine amidotransferase n=1 Tax=Ancylobacter sp. sgz301288 TaxID=3342077 RepID=UPI00385C583B